MAENNNAPETKRVDKEIEAAGEEEPKVLFIELDWIKSIAEIWIVLKIER